MEWFRSIMLPPQGSEFAGEVDTLYMFLFWLCSALFIGIAFAAIYFAYRYKFTPGRVTPHITHNTTLEVVWTILPLILCGWIFFWGLNGWMKYSVAPGESMEIQITAKKWIWTFEYPDGSRTANDIHVPVNKPVKFIMTSEDVLHDFFVPDMRVKHDIVPGRYTEVWFTPTILGAHHFTCAEYCGKGHSDMMGKLTVDSEADFKKWLETGGDDWKNYAPEVWGQMQREQKGCATCHSIDGTRGQGPSWKGIYGKMEKMADGKEYLVDDAYLQESMMFPNAKTVAGFEQIMPSFQGLLHPQDVRGLIAYIKSLK